MLHFESTLGDYERWLASSGRSLRTIESYAQLLRLLGAHGVNPVSADWRELVEFLSARDYAVESIRTYQSYLRAWYRWLVRAGIRADDPTLMLARPRGQRRAPHPVTTEELARLLGAPLRRRTHAMILLGAYAGFRAGEIARVRGEDFRDGTLRVKGKGGVIAAQPMHPMLSEARAMMPARGYWFAGVDRGHVHARSISRTLSDVMRRHGVQGTAHSLRHWYLSEQLRNGANIRVVQENARHASLATTQIYTLVEDAQRREAVLSLPAALVRVA